MRKIFIVSTCVLLIAMMAIPAFAGNNSIEEYVYYPVLEFDVINVTTPRSPNYHTIPFPFNSSMNEGDVDLGDFSLNDGDFWGSMALAHDQDAPNPRIVGTIGSTVWSSNSGNNSYVQFVGYNKIVDVPKLTGEVYIEYPRTDMSILATNLYVEYYVIGGTSIEGEDGSRTYEYTGDSYVFTHTERYYPNNVIDVAYQFRRLASSVGADLIFIKEMRYEIVFTTVTTSTIYFDFTIGTTGRDREDAYNWIDWFNAKHLGTENVIVEVNPVEDTTSWLTATVESFFEMEIFPNFSINDLFLVVVTVGLLLWFITLLI